MAAKLGLLQPLGFGQPQGGGGMRSPGLAKNAEKCGPHPPPLQPSAVGGVLVHRVGAIRVLWHPWGPCSSWWAARPC